MLNSKPVDAFIKYRGLLQNYQKRIIKTYCNICFKMHVLSSKAAKKKPKLFLNTLLPLWCATNRKAEESRYNEIRRQPPRADWPDTEQIHK